MYQILKLSNYIEENHKKFSNTVLEIYNFMDDISEEYRNFFLWYWKKVVPDILNGTREIFIATINKKIVGVAILKRKKDEKKICSIFVIKEQRNKGIATALLEKSFDYLKTNKPLISISENKLQQFSSIIKKYNWKQEQVLEKGYYNKTSREIVFNGKILWLKKFNRVILYWTFFLSFDLKIYLIIVLYINFQTHHLLVLKQHFHHIFYLSNI